MGQCGKTIVAEDADGNSYTSLKVGPHCWLKPNLSIKLDSSKIYKSEMYPDTNANLATFGRLYDWYTAMNVQPGQSPVVGDHGFVQGVCPEGWHLPTAAEARELMNHDAKTLHSTERWFVPGTNTTGFTMLPGGYYNAMKKYGENLGGDCYMWSAQSLDPPNPTVIWSDCHCEYFLVNRGTAKNGMSVRCVYKIYQGEVTTDSANQITSNSATLWGNVTFNGYAESYERGFVYGTDPDNLDQWVVENPAASDETAPFNTEITGLTVATTYYYQAYIVNDFDTAYGEVKSFAIDLAVTTNDATDVKSTSATLNGELTKLEGYANVNAGFKYGTSASALTSIVVKDAAMAATGLFSCDIDGLTANTQYYFKAFAANGTDTVYGEVKNFTTLTDVVTDTIAFVPNGGQGAMDTMFVTRGDTVLNANTYTHGGNWHFDGWNTAADGSGTQYADHASITTNGNLTLYAQWHTWCTGIPKTSVNEFGTSRIDSVKDIDNNKYNVVQIGNQCWLKENLRTLTNSADTGIIYTPTTTGYDVETYGRLYDWYAVMQGASSSALAPSDVQGICPAGWHVPSNAEWDTLTNYVNGKTEYQCNGDKTIAKSLAATAGWAYSQNNCTVGNLLSSNNSTGFCALPAGYYYPNDATPHKSFGNAIFFSSATVGVNDNNCCTRGIAHTSFQVSSAQNTQNVIGLSVRCLRDAEAPAAMSVTTDSANTVTNNSATLHGNVTNMGGKDNVYAGFKYGTSESALTSIASDESAMYATGRFNYTITGLTANTQYYFKAFAANGTDTVYGEVKDFKTPAAVFTCGTDSVKDIDENWYHTVQIGNQCWMKENLRTKTSAYGNVWTNPDVDSTIYGRYYDWAAVMQDESGDKVRGICPEGWHVPSDAEWTQLTTYVKSVSEYVCDGCSGIDSESYTSCIAKALSQPTGWSNTGTGCNAGNTGDKANLTGFSAVPAGGYIFGGFSGFGINTCFWSATQKDDSTVWCRYLVRDDSNVNRLNYTKNRGYSVRCLKD